MTDMFSPGATLRAAREKRRLTQAEIAETTRIKVPIIEAIENNDFSRIAAPLYGKGFIKLYAEAVGLDPEPLVRDYMERHARTVHPSLKSDRPPSAPADNGIPMPSTLDRFRSSGGVAWSKVVADVSAALKEVAETLSVAWVRWRMSRRSTSDMTRRYTRGYAGPVAIPIWRYAAIGVALLIVVVLLIAGLGLLFNRSRDQPAVTVPATAKPSLSARPLRLQEEPPPAHLRLPAP
jgi:transcriptional regulator with XRE-family HTH domain